MPAREEIAYFGAGPARLPTAVLERAASSLLNHDSTGLGLNEHSHRSALSADILSSVVETFKALLNVPDDGSYTVLFMQGGGTMQFSAAVYNLLGNWVQTQLDSAGGDLEVVRQKLKDLKLDYLITGAWSLKASEEAERLLGAEFINQAVDARRWNDGKFGDVPEERYWRLTEEEKSLFTYYCDNETVDGVEFPGFPETLGSERLVVCDMSSNILSRKFDVKKYAMIFAGAQKNVGTTGLTLVLIRTSIVRNQPPVATLRALGLPIPPIMLDFKTIFKNNSLYNTLPIFDVWVAGEVMKGLVAAGGLEAQERVSRKKSDMLYGTLAKWPGLYYVVPLEGARSRMNICFRVVKGGAGGGSGGDDAAIGGVREREGALTDDLEKKFVSEAEELGMVGLKGHRSVGGIRISNYNAITEEEVEKVVGFLNDFGEKYHS